MNTVNTQGKDSKAVATKITSEQFDSIKEMKDEVLSQLQREVEKNAWMGSNYPAGKTYNIENIKLQFICKGSSAFGKGELIFIIYSKDWKEIYNYQMPLDFELKEEPAELRDVINEVKKIDFDEYWDMFINSIKVA